MRCRLGLVALTAVALLTGCGAPSGAPEAPGTAPATPSPTVSETPAVTATPDPSASPGVGAVATPPAPTGTSPAAPRPESAPYCGDAYVLLMFSTAPAAWVGTDAEVLEQANARVGFEPQHAIDGLDVHCTVTYTSPTDGGPGGTVSISTALLERDDAALAQLAAWSAANGYEADPGVDADSYGERAAPANADGTTTTKIFWAPLDGDSPMIGGAQQIVDLTGAPPDAILVVFSDFTQPQPQP